MLALGPLLRCGFSRFHLLCLLGRIGSGVLGGLFHVVVLEEFLGALAIATRRLVIAFTLDLLLRHKASFARVLERNPMLQFARRGTVLRHNQPARRPAKSMALSHSALHQGAMKWPAAP